MKFSGTKWIVAAAATATVAFAGSANAASILTTTSLDAAFSTSVDSVSGDFLDFDSNDVGDLESEVLTDGNDFVYVYEVETQKSNISEFNLSFPVTLDVLAGSTPGEAGFEIVNDPGADFTLDQVVQDTDGTVDWEITSGFDAGDIVKFFFYTSEEPVAPANVNLIDGTTGRSLAVSPVPSPTAALAALPILGAIALRRRLRA